MEMDCRVFPSPISSARIPFRPFSARWIIQFRDSTWYGLSFPNLMQEGCCVRKTCRSPPSSSSIPSSPLSALSASCTWWGLEAAARRFFRRVSVASFSASALVASSMLPSPFRSLAKIGDCLKRYSRRFADFLARSLLSLSCCLARAASCSAFFRRRSCVSHFFASSTLLRRSRSSSSISSSRRIRRRSRAASFSARSWLSLLRAPRLPAVSPSWTVSAARRSSRILRRSASAAADSRSKRSRSSRSEAKNEDLSLSFIVLQRAASSVMASPIAMFFSFRILES
mmetsp:Transcript_5634/g.14075  ORF Transcript_5634/g.14075 Transcript_5634/m.14075 type:complete len:284 (-) Transcript_5634:730-1581(-)